MYAYIMNIHFTITKNLYPLKNASIFLFFELEFRVVIIYGTVSSIFCYYQYLIFGTIGNIYYFYL